jgi:phosphoglycerate kinase
LKNKKKNKKKKMLSKKIGLDQITKHLKNSKVLMRVDFNVPLKENKVSDPTRIIGSIPSIKKILSENPKSLVLMSHLGRPDGKVVSKHSLGPVVPKL